MPKMPYNFKQEFLDYINSSEQKKTQVCDSEKLTKAMGGGFPESSLNLVVAKSGFGKSNFLISTARELAEQCKYNLTASVEMTMEKYIPRLTACISGINIETIERIKKAENPYLADKFEMIESMLDFYPIATFYPKTIEEIVVKAKMDKAIYGTKHLLIDHFSEIQTNKVFKSSDDNGKQRYILQILEDLYKQEGFCIIMACQFKKGLEKNNDFGDRDRDEIKGISELVTKASNVLYLYQSQEQWQSNQQYQGHDVSTRATIKLLKAREGWEDYKEEVYYDKKRFRFSAKQEATV